MQQVVYRIQKKVGPASIVMLAAILVITSQAHSAQAESSPTPPMVQTNSVEKELSTLNALYVAKQFSEAADGYIQFLAVHALEPEREEAIYKLGDIYRQTGKTKDAMGAFDLVLKEFPKGNYASFAKMRRGEIFLTDGNPSDALAMFLDVLESSKSAGLTLNANFQAALALQKLNRTDESIPYLEALRTSDKNNPYKPFADLALGKLNEIKGNHKIALDHFKAALTSPESTPEMRGEAGVRAGMVSLALKQFKEAAAYFDAVRRVDAPESWRQFSHIGLLRSRFALDDYEGIIDLYPEVETALPKGAAAEALYYMANSRRFTKNFPVALETYNFLLTQAKGSPYEELASYERLLVLMSLQSDNLLPDAEAFLSAFPASEKAPFVRYLSAELSFENSDYETAAKAFQQIVESGQPPNAQETSLFKLAWSLYATRDFPRAAKTFERFVREMPSSPSAPEALWQLGLAEEQLSSYDTSLQTWNQLQEQFPGAPQVEQAIYRSALLLGKQGRLEKSRDELSRYLKLFPKGKMSAHARYWKGWTQFELKDYTEALVELEAGRKADPDYYAPSTERLVFAAYHTKKADKLAQFVKEWDELAEKTPGVKPTDPTVLFWLAQFYDSRKKWVESEALYSRLIRSGAEPHYLDALHGAGVAMLQQKKFQSAIKSLEQFRESSGDTEKSTHAMLPLAKAYLGAGNYPLATTYAEQLMLRIPEGRLNAEARLVIGDAYTGREMFADAAKYYSLVVQLFDEPDLLPEAVRKGAAAYRKSGNSAEASKLEAELAKKKKKD